MNDERGPFLSRAACFALAVAAVLLLFTHRLIEGQNDLSRMVAVESLALRGHFYVDDAPQAQRIVEEGGQRFHYLIDMVYNKRDGHFYSSKPPVLTIILAAVPALLHAIGLRSGLTGAGSELPLMLLTWVIIGWASAGAFYAFRRKAGDLIERPAVADLVTVLTLGGTLFLSYSATVNHHTPTAAAILGAFCLLGMAEAGRKVSDGRAALAGLPDGAGGRHRHRPRLHLFHRVRPLHPLLPALLARARLLRPRQPAAARPPLRRAIQHLGKPPAGADAQGHQGLSVQLLAPQDRLGRLAHLAGALLAADALQHAGALRARAPSCLSARRGWRRTWRRACARAAIRNARAGRSWR